MDVIDKPLGSEGHIDVKLEGGNAVISITHNHASGSVSVVAKENAKYFLDKLKVLIPGKIDDMVIDVVESQIP